MAESEQPKSTGLAVETRAASGGRALTPPSGLAWRIGVGVLWVAVVLLAYYAVHKPVTVADWQALIAAPTDVHVALSAVAGRLWGEVLDLLAAAWVLLLAGAIGQAVWRVTRWPDPGSALSRLVGSILGLAVFALALFGIGLAGWLSLPLVLALMLVPSVALWRVLWVQACWWQTTATGWWRAVWASERIERVLACFVAASCALVLIAALLPPTLAWDALSYHLVSARQYATSGHVAPDPANPQTYQPQLTEMLYAALYLLRGGDTAAAPLHAGIGLVLLGLIAWWGWRVAGPRGSVRAAALLLGIPTVTLIAGWPYVDLTLAAAEVCALLALVAWDGAVREGRGAAARGWLMAAGVSGGIALDTKYTAAYALAALGALVVLRGVARQVHGGPVVARAWAALRPAVVFAATAGVIGSPWLLRNLIVAGDPLFPYHLGPLFPGGPGWDAGRTAYMQGRGLGLSVLWRGPLLVLEPVLLGQQGSSEFDATLGPLLLVLLPLGALTLRMRWSQPRSMRLRTWLQAVTEHWLYWPLGCAALMGVIWAEELARSQVAMQSRLFLITFVVLAVPAAVAWLRVEAIAVPSISLARLASAAAMLCLALTLLSQGLQTLQRDNLAELTGVQSRVAYENQQLGPYAAAMRELNTLPGSAHVLLLFEPRSYLTHAHATPDVFLDELDVLYRRCGANGITRCLRQQGFSYVLWYQEGMTVLQSGQQTPIAQAEYAALRAAMRAWQPVYRDNTPLVGPTPSGTGWYVLFSLERTP